jgi:putative two-component system response regulator
MNEKKLKIIAIDDQPENLQMIVQILKGEYAVIATTNGKMAVELAKKHQDTAVILLDMFMPEMSGIDVLLALKAEPTTAHIPVIFVTGNNDELDYEKGLALGAYDFVLKPISPSLLINRIRHCLSER